MPLLTALLLPTPARAQITCVGDCDGDGRVTRAEIVTGTRIALGDESPDACPSLARGAAVGVDDLVTGVRNSADGCIEKLGAAQVGPSLLMLRALTRWAVALGGSFNGFNSEPRSGAPSTVPDGFSACGLSGTETRSCEEPADGVAAIRFELDRCAFNAVDLTMEVDGALRLFGSGLCPGILLPGENWTEIETEQIVRRAGELLWVQQHQLGGILHEMVQGFAICPLAAISFTMSGPTRQEFADGTSLQLDVRSGRLSVAFLPIGAECAPALITARFDGEVTLFDGTAEPPVAVRARAEDFEVEVRRGNILGNRMDVRGRLASECLGVGVRFAAAGQPPPDLVSACVFGGEVELSSGQHRARVHTGAGGSVQIDAGADGTVDEVFASCLDEPLRAGGGCVELATPTPRPTPTPTLPPAWPLRIRGDLSYPPANRARQSGVIGPGECFDIWNEPGGSACGGRHDVARCCVDDDGYLYAHYVNCAEGEAEGEHVDSRCSYAFKGHTARCCF